jgi:hypothetical protein
MYSIVKLLRNNGISRPRIEVTDDPGHEGELRFEPTGSVYRATLTEPEDEHMRLIIPALEHAQLVVMRVDMMLFRGIERGNNGAGCEQEWSVKIIGY